MQNRFLTLRQDLIRISVGTEHIDDIIADFEQSFAKSIKAETPAQPAASEAVDATPATSEPVPAVSEEKKSEEPQSQEANATETGDTEHPATLATAI